MTVLWESELYSPLYARLAPYARATLERSAEHALALHAEELAPEHLLSTLLTDESGGATRLILFAFADPETLAAEILALSPGIMVVGAKRTLPFSVRGAQALEAALDVARSAGVELVEPEHVLEAAWRRLTRAQRSALGESGGAPAPEAGPQPGSGARGVLLRYFSREACRSLGAASRIAQRWRRDSITPAHLVVGAIEVDASLLAGRGLGAALVPQALAGRDEDETLPLPRALAPDARLRSLLGSLPQAADTLAILRWFLCEGSAEVRELLRRQRVTRELVERAGEAFGDP